MELELEYKILVDENERDEAKLHFLKSLGAGETKKLHIVVGPYKGSSFERRLNDYLNFKLEIASSDVSEKGFFSKKRTTTFKTHPMVISDDAMTNLSHVFYDVILAFDVKVDITAA
ncbi:hypothetical protein A7985_07540 [Pseudoalteromonas luteoviolacea]|uniref:Uncharacterized protein n=1 Tax=Pseudoalteromonas luteoviolacea TaxID=43657 RepID=A0A1C0TX19_9GAMM|nr:hypothetical protein [Pseudoalteromonas luteoviolacea]OCQ23784.1 hypothetical protein A7985_07540 [Pseudoalteromonas luteoviolacea]